MSESKKWYEILQEKWGFTPPDATGEPGYPKWLTDMPFVFRMPTLFVVSGVLWIVKQVGKVFGR